MNRIKTPPIIITGCARSGTSMTAGVVNLSGAFGGKMHPANKYNAKGMFENIAIKQNIDKPFLRSIGCDPRGQHPLPDREKLVIPNDWRQRVEDIFLAEGYEGGPWFIKLARACLTWPVWHHAFPTAKWVVVRRMDQDIIDSCMRTGFMSHYQNEEGWQGWIDEHKAAFVEMVESGLNVTHFWPEQMILSNYQPAYTLIDWLGLKWDPDGVENFISPKLWHPRRKQIARIAQQKRKK